MPIKPHGVWGVPSLSTWRSFPRGQSHIPAFSTRSSTCQPSHDPFFNYKHYFFFAPETSCKSNYTECSFYRWKVYVLSKILELKSYNSQGCIKRWVIGRWLGHEGGAFQNGISALQKRLRRAPYLSGHAMIQWEVWKLKLEDGLPPDHSGTLKSDSQSTEHWGINSYCVSVTHSAVFSYSRLKWLQQPPHSSGIHVLSFSRQV